MIDLWYYFAEKSGGFLLISLGFVRTGPVETFIPVRGGKCLIVE